MQADYPQRFDREMGCTEAEWLGWLPAAIGAQAWTREGAAAVVEFSPGSLRLDWRAGTPRVIALMRMPRLHVSFRFDGVDAQRRLVFMKRFDLYMQRGGG